MYKKLGQFQYQHQDFTSGPIQQSTSETIRDDIKATTMGQLKEGTHIQEGIGIAVYSNGDIYEGFWKDGRFNGKGMDSIIYYAKYTQNVLNYLF